MKKMNKKIVVFALAAACLCALVGCGPTEEEKKAEVNGTYTLVVPTEDCEGELTLGGFLDAASAWQTNTLVLEDGKYTLTKEVEEGEGAPVDINIVFTFTGTYAVEEDKITLNPAEDCEFAAELGQFTEHGCKNSSGKASAGDVVNLYGDEKHDPLEFFSTEYVFEAGNEATVVTVNSEEKSYSYQDAE